MRTATRTGSALCLVVLTLAGCVGSQTSGATGPSDSEIENVVRRSYQYVAMYNTNNNFAMMKANPYSTGGWNKMFVPTSLTDHTLTAIPRPNNDSLYLISMLDLRDDAVVIRFPCSPRSTLPRGVGS